MRWKCYREATRDAQMQFLVNWESFFQLAETTLSYPGPNHLNQETFKGKIHLLSSQFVATGGGFVQDISLTEAKLSGM